MSNFAQRFFHDVRDNCREKATELDVKSGTVRISVCPMSNSASTLFGGFPEDEPQTVVERSYTLRYNTEHAILKDDDLISTFGYSAQKAACGIDMMLDDSEDLIFSGPPSGLHSDITRHHEEYYQATDCGFAYRYGMISTLLKMDDEDFARIFVTVSGGSQEDDLRCSVCGIEQSVYTGLFINEEFRIVNHRTVPILLDGKTIHPVKTIYLVSNRR